MKRRASFAAVAFLFGCAERSTGLEPTVSPLDHTCSTWRRSLPSGQCPEEYPTGSMQYRVRVTGPDGREPTSLAPGDPVRVVGELTNLAAADLTVEGCVGRTWMVEGPSGSRTETMDCRKRTLVLQQGEAARSSVYVRRSDSDVGQHRAVVVFSEPDPCCACGDWSVEVPRVP